MAQVHLERVGDFWTIAEAGKYLYSRYNPTRLPQRIANSVPILKQCIYFVPSPLLGYGIEVLLQRIPEDSIVLAVEQSQEMMALCSSKISPELLNHERVVWVRLSNKTSLHTVLTRLGRHSFRRMRRIDFNGGSLLPNSVYDDLEDFIVNDIALYWKNRLVIRQLGRLWIRHTYANLAHLATGKSELSMLNELEFHANLTLIAGAGPSLELALPLISDFRNDIFLLATDTSLPLFLQVGIQPDAVLALDTQFWNYLDFHDSHGSEIPVIADMSVYPRILNTTGGSCYLFSSTFSDLEFLQRLEEAGLREDRLEPLGSVGIAAVEIAVQYFTSPVVLTGLDFSYDRGKSHARGSSAHIWQLLGNRRLTPCPGLLDVMRRPGITGETALGDSVQSDAILLDYALRFAERYGRRDGIFVLEPGGIDLHVPVISASDFRSRLMESRKNEKTRPFKARPREDHPKNKSGAARRFIHSEQQRLEGILKAWDEYSRDKEAVEAFLESLRGMEYVYYDFPDYHRVWEKDETFLFRVAKRARYYENYLKRIMG